MQPNYDCTIRVGTPSSPYMDFKCHKDILSNDSAFFERTFFGYFKESKMGPDEPILLDNIDPAVFECALRHMYGQENDIKNTSVSFKVKVYKFADEMLIKSLVQELDSCFIGTTAPDIFSVFDLYVFLSNQLGINSCKEILAKVTAEDFRSEHWNRISPATVEEFLKMDCLDVEEADLARALVSWGRFQVHTERGDPKDVERLRSKILPGLKWIRFAVLHHEKFAQLCREELGALLREEEKKSIFMAIATCKQALFPPVQKRKSPPTVFKLPFLEHFNPIARQDIYTANLIFHVDKSAEFMGLQVITSKVTYGPFKFELYNTHSIIRRGGWEGEKMTYCGEEYYPIIPKCILTAGAKYILSFTFPRHDAFLNIIHVNYPYYTLPLNKVTYNGLTLTIDSPKVHVFVKRMLFVEFP